MWKKLGKIFKANGQFDWMQSHTAMPMVLHLSNDRYRIYFGTRNSHQQPHVGYIELSIKNPQEILTISKIPTLGPGQADTFDSNGVYPGSIISLNHTIRMYYMGRKNLADGSFEMAIGLANSKDAGKTFKRQSLMPIMSKSSYDPWMVSTPWVMRDGSNWRMWYLSGIKYHFSNGILKSKYNIKYAESEDGMSFNRNGLVAIDLEGEETNIAAPTVMKIGNSYFMWFSVSGGSGYRISMAESSNGYVWKRKNAIPGLDLSNSGWDSSSMSYPCVFKHKHKLYMVYSGNQNGLDGIGLAVLPL